MKVYVLYSEVDEEILGVSSTEKRAEELRDKDIAKRDRPGLKSVLREEWYYIEEFDLIW